MEGGGMAGAATSVFAAASTPATAIERYATLVLGITGAIFVVVAGLLAYCVVRYRQRPGDDAREPPQVYGSDQVELAWTTVPVLIVLVLGLTTTRVIQEIQNPVLPPTTLEVAITGHQWWWEIRYPGLAVVTANELHVPVSDPASPTPTRLTLASADVVHSFWVPRLAGKTDLIPNRVNETWIDPHTPGVYLGQCAEYCGTQHAKMLLRVVVEPRAAFDRWIAAQRALAAADPAVVRGRQVFESTACINCHTVAGTVADGRFGPDLTHLMSRATLASGAAPNTPDALRTWLRDPDDIKPGVLMPTMALDDSSLDALVAYLRTLD
jgi:cytochrome c oxidase subunit 2